MYPFALIAFAVSCFYAASAWRQPRAAAFVATFLWLLYGVFEVLVAQAVLCDEKCNIRVDLLLIWPILWVASFFASKPPGPWSLRTKVIGVLSMGTLTLALGTVLVLFLEERDVFFPARRDCKAGGDAAALACDEALRQAPGDFTLYYHRGLNHRAAAEYDRGIADMTKAIEAYADFADAHTGRGTLYLDKGNTQQAISDFNAALEITPHDRTPYYWRGRAYAEAGELDRAEADYTKALTLSPSASPVTRLSPAGEDILERRGLVYLRLGRFDKALSDYEAALKGDPKHARALYGRGLAKAGSGDKTGGDADMARALELNAKLAAEFPKPGP